MYAPYIFFSFFSPLDCTADLLFCVVVLKPKINKHIYKKIS